MASKFKVTPALLKKLSIWASNGLTRTDVAHLLGYSKNHWLEMMRSNVDLENAYMVGRSEQKSLLLDATMKRALNDDHKDCHKASEMLIGRLDRDDVAQASEGSVGTVSDVELAQGILDDLTA